MARKTAISADVYQSTLTLTFADGRDIAIDLNSLSESIKQQAMLHGLKQKLVDAAALSRNPETGRSATLDDKFAAVKEVADRITSADGTWNKERKSGDAAENGGNLLLRAIQHMTGKDRTYAESFLNSKTKEQRAALKKNPRVLSAMAELQAATVVGGVNTDELLGELGIDVQPEPAEPAPAAKPANRTRRKAAPAVAE